MLSALVLTNGSRDLSESGHGPFYSTVGPRVFSVSMAGLVGSENSNEDSGFQQSGLSVSVVSLGVLPEIVTLALVILV